MTYGRKEKHLSFQSENVGSKRWEEGVVEQEVSRQQALHGKEELSSVRSPHAVSGDSREMESVAGHRPRNGEEEGHFTDEDQRPHRGGIVGQS